MKKIIVMILTVLTVFGAGLTSVSAANPGPASTFRPHGVSSTICSRSARVFRPHTRYNSGDSSAAKVYRPIKKSDDAPGGTVSGSKGSKGTSGKKSNSNDTAYISESGEKTKIYHTDPNCGNIKSISREMTIAEAESKGFSLCENCYDRDH